ncbi:MAG: DUF4838 domain-containing protein [Armatimonadetes bacterium]|nr:DUF4838 domain-containing protein [Armatimonadota bacterium]
MATQRCWAGYSRAVPLLCALAAGSAHAGGVELVRDGRPLAALVIDSRRYPLQQDLTNPWAIVERTIANIAATVVDYVRQSTGATLPVADLATGPAPTDVALVYLGRSAEVDRAVGHELDRLDPSGYLIRALDERHLVVAGLTSEGTEFGTFELLERFVGVRWLLPTAIGDYVPAHRALAVPAGTNLRDAPAFMQVPAVASKPTHQVWARRMRFWTRLNFHHNLVNLFPPTRYAKTHPEFYPVVRAGDTARYLPTGNTEDWQPCFTAPGIVDEAARNIIAWLDANPRFRSYSFGVNDSDRYCQCERCRKEYLAGETFLGMPCYSDAYYRFVNAVAEKVVRTHPDVWFGCLAYSNVGKPPVHLGVHPRVIPFLTYDTMQLLDPERRRQHEALVEAWGRRCTFLGRYDYTYGDHHVPPRLYLHHWAESVRWARAHKVRAWYAETYPFFGEAPKYYVMAKLWWNPDRNVDALLAEWYRLAFGRAAPPMRAYFDHWETYWTRRVPQSDFFQRCRHEQYLLGNPGWLERLRADDLQRADAWIAEAGRLADTPQTRARVAIMARAWEYYRTVIATYLARGQATDRLPVDAAVSLLGRRDMPLAQPLRALHDRLMQDPILVFTWDASYPYGTAERAPFLDAAETFLDTRDPRLADALGALARGPDPELSAVAATVLAVAEGRARNLVPNSGFETPNPLDGWWAGMHLGTGTVRVTDEQPFEGAHAIEVTGTWDGYGGVFRTDVPAEPGQRYLFVLRARWEGAPAAGTTCQMLTQFRDAEGRILPDSLRGHSFRCNSEWRAFALETRAAPVGTVALVTRVDALGQPRSGYTAWFDALQVYRVADHE